MRSAASPPATDSDRPCPSAPHRARRTRTQDESRNEVQVPAQERVDAVRPFWESLSQEERVALLTIDIELLREKAREIDAIKAQQPAGGCR